jgi:hypothetical protein
MVPFACLRDERGGVGKGGSFAWFLLVVTSTVVKCQQYICIPPLAVCSALARPFRHATSLGGLGNGSLSYHIVASVAEAGG